MEELRIENRVAYFRKAITAPDFGSDSVLTRDAFSYVALWLTRQKDAPKATKSYWRQSEEYYRASLTLSPISAPLTLYYCFLNATKALLSLKATGFSEYHGMSVKFISSKRELINEQTKIKRDGIIVALSKHLWECENQTTHNLKCMLSQLPYIHRAFCLTYKTQPNLFIPVQNPRYVIDQATKRVRLRTTVSGRFADGRSMATLPTAFEQVPGEPMGVIQSIMSVQWYARRANAAQREQAVSDLQVMHRLLRAHLAYISGSTDLWYIRRDGRGVPNLRRYGPTLTLAAMHRLSELSRYDPAGLEQHLAGKRNWLLSEFLQLSPVQFIDEIACEMTGEELRIPGIRG